MRHVSFRCDECILYRVYVIIWIWDTWFIKNARMWYKTKTKHLQFADTTDSVFKDFNRIMQCAQADWSNMHISQLVHKHPEFHISCAISTKALVHRNTCQNICMHTSITTIYNHMHRADVQSRCSKQLVIPIYFTPQDLTNTNIYSNDYQYIIIRTHEDEQILKLTMG